MVDALGLRHAAGAPRARALRRRYWERRFAGGKRSTLLASYPKAGRTWLRFLIAEYYNHAQRLGLDIDFESVFSVVPNYTARPPKGFRGYVCARYPEVPLVVATHRSHTYEFDGLATIMLVRSPLDVIVSRYFHDNRRRRVVELDLREYVRSPLGVDAVVSYLNSWADTMSAPSSLTLSYEGLRRDTAGSLARVVTFLGSPVDSGAIEYAIELSRFDRMRMMETTRGTVPGVAVDTADEEAQRVRRGRVGGFSEHLTTTEAESILGELDARLDARVWEVITRDCLEPPRR